MRHFPLRASSSTRTGTTTHARSPGANSSSITNSTISGGSPVGNPSFYVFAILGDSLSDTGAR